MNLVNNFITLKKTISYHPCYSADLGQGDRDVEVTLGGHYVFSEKVSPGAWSEDILLDDPHAEELQYRATLEVEIRSDTFEPAGTNSGLPLKRSFGVGLRSLELD